MDAPAALLSAGLGFLSGGAASALMERFKSQAAGIEVELGRIDDLHELLQDTASLAVDDLDRRPQLRQLSMKRLRIGKALRRQIPDSDAFDRAAAKLNIVTGLIAKAEEGVPITEVEMEMAFSALRRSFSREARHRRTYVVLRS